MTQTAKELLIIYETEADQWATYLQSVFTGPMSKDGICCYDIAAFTKKQDDFLELAGFPCKLLILSKGLLEGLCQLKRFFLARVLSPAAQVVVLLCGVESLAPLLDLVPLDADECLQISSEQDTHEYLSTVTDIVRKGVSAKAANILQGTRKHTGSEQKPSDGAHSVTSSMVVVPSRIPCRGSTEVFILLKNTACGGEAEVEFTGENQTVRVTPDSWNEQILCVNTPDFPASSVRVTVYRNGVPLGKAEIQFYSNTEEITHLLSRVTDPVDFMCQAFQVPSVEQLDQKLFSLLLEAMPTGGFQGLQCKDTPAGGTPVPEHHQADSPSILHFAAKYGLKSVCSLLLQCPGAEQAMRTANRHGQTPAEIAMSHNHTELHVLLKETLDMFDSSENENETSVYEMMCTAGIPAASDMQQQHSGRADEGEEEEDPYAPLGENDEYDTILTSERPIANRPPAPTPRPATAEDRTPYNTQVFQKKDTAHVDSAIYSLPTKQVRGQEDSVSSAYDTFLPNVELQQKVQVAPPAVCKALANVSDPRAAQRGRDFSHQGRLLQSTSHWSDHRKLSQPGTCIFITGEDEDGVYDKINTVHHSPFPRSAVRVGSSPPHGSSTVTNGGRRGGSPLVDFYSRPHKGQHSIFFWKTDKQ